MNNGKYRGCRRKQPYSVEARAVSGADVMKLNAYYGNRYNVAQAGIRLAYLK